MLTPQTKRIWAIMVGYLCFSILWIYLTDPIIRNYFGGIQKYFILKRIIFNTLSAIFFLIYLMKKNQASKKIEERFRLFIDHSSDIVVVIDLKGNIDYASPSVESVFGYKVDEYKGESIFHFLKESVVDDMKKRFKLRDETATEDTFVIPFKHKEGNIVLLESKCIPILDDFGQVKQFAYISQDITEKTIALKKQIETEERYQKLVEHSPETTLIYNKKGEVVYINRAGIEQVGAKSFEEVIGMNVMNLIAPESAEKVKERLAEIIQGGKPVINEYFVNRLDGKQIVAEILSFQTTYNDEAVFQVIMRDVTERKEAAKQLETIAYTDTLTGLGNRNALYKDLDKSITRHTKQDKSLIVYFVDLDRFKTINDTFGHTFGDMILQKVSERIKENACDCCHLYRVGADGYVVIHNQADETKAESFANKLIKAFDKPFSLDERVLYLTVSIGISVFPTDGDTVEALIQQADTALYTAKANGKNHYTFYSNDIKTANDRKMELEMGIRKGLENNEFMLHYQPQIDLITHEIIGAEALIRWIHPTLGFISPLEFIPIAEESGLITQVGKWVLETACRQFNSWLSEGHALKSVAVNVSGVQFKDRIFAKTVEQVLKETNLAPHYLDLEITESVTQDAEESILIMNELKALGVSLSMDDFGTGYSSFSYLRQFPIDKLKIDKSFIDEIETETNAEAIVKAIIELGNTLGYNIVAEGVETKEQGEFLKRQNCQYAQGYYFSRPLPAIEITNVLKNKIG
ncbi:GGDEF domain-containing protein [Bacillus sp. AFS002410]|uniref:bifunctional diguanylate cyclase/phosphodiesterase n=1 Tax=Bacillus sp. AFS002410 TaxID=2033481 RepID=UPI000BEF4AF4|nr:bifunctional diguanylate cyclase/phosphodiesterase [Bacillus sp. AFS002410]PEJ48518.1 GGDEF domain-containing protein [Bacillus sp. AFS002410]